MKKIFLIASVVLLPALASAQDKQWYLLDAKTDQAVGISSERAYRELLKNRKPTPVVVAVIDGGIDTAHTDLKRVLWNNPKELAGNGKDDDKNGYVDDTHGWNFIGGKDGRNVQYETSEATRLYAMLKPKYEKGGTLIDRKTLKPAQQTEFDQYVKIKGDFEKNAQNYRQQYAAYSAYLTQFTAISNELKQALGVTTLDTATLQKANPTDPILKQRVTGLLKVMQAQNLGSDADLINELQKDSEQLKSRAEYAYNPAYDARAIVGDNPNDLTERNYGNADVDGPDARHGSHVAGIIGADRTNNAGILGISDAVQIMGVRAVPDGDERDKDVANAIRYAVDNGAQIINMSFGKDYSPQRQTVDDALHYAQQKGVLLVHAAGNDGKNIDTAANFPADKFMDGSPIPNMITVGASSRTNDRDLVASFSNYGKHSVDVFAPGSGIYSTVPGSEYENLSGTSMASPVVAGVAAVLKSYFPKLTATDLKRIIEKSAVVYHTQVRKPESDQLVDFAELSKTGGIVNVYEAVKLALAQETAK